MRTSRAPFAMSLWNNRGFSENELSPFERWLVGLTVGAALLIAGVVALGNALRGLAPHPWGFAVVVLGFVLFLVPKVQVVRQGRLISFGARHMSVAQGNAYRLGWYLMAAGFLLTFG